ncbi:Uncharacterised protein [Ewingella americana]|uniref:Uncharacterized protein n=1 Tax=Ewingella americana TaxID=41202 RepID=A0A377NHV1_9GAMM|nr:Uncharacterised protein [Ewingella americana]
MYRHARRDFKFKFKFKVKVKVVRCRHTGLEGAYRRALKTPRLYTARFARWPDVFQVLQLSTAKCRRLGGSFATGFEP